MVEHHPQWHRRFAVAACVLFAAGCTDAEGLRSDGEADTVQAPLSLWPKTRPLPPRSGEDRGLPAQVPGVAVVHSRSMRDVDAVDVVKADLAAAGRADKGAGTSVDPRAVDLLRACTGTECRVRPAVYRDLTHDGEPELITAVDIDGRASELRVYTATHRAVTRILSRRAALQAVEVAAGHLTVREPTANPLYVSVSTYKWEKDMMRLNGLALDKCLAGNAAESPCTASDA